MEVIPSNSGKLRGDEIKPSPDNGISRYGINVCIAFSTFSSRSQSTVFFCFWIDFCHSKYFIISQINNALDSLASIEQQ